MSFSEEVKQELFDHREKHAHCEVAELAAILLYKGKTIGEVLKKSELMETGELDLCLQKGFTLAQKNIKISTSVASPQIRERDCCKRAFLRGAFLAVGSMSNPEKGYHLEFACNEKVHAQILIDEMSFFGIDARMTLRKRYFVVYVKEGAAISDLLSIMGAPVSMMSFENDRILRDVRNSVNRKVNCETANLAKTVNAASKQVQDIQLIEETIGLEELPTSLQEMAEVRLAYPDATLTELGNYLDPPVGKSGVNHRLRKLGEIASKLRE